MSEQQSYLIIGNGIAGATAAEILRTEDSAAEITVIAEDPFPVYFRPALKDYLGGKVREDKLWARPISFYQNRRVRFLTDKVVGIQGGQHSVQLLSGGGQSAIFDYCLLMVPAPVPSPYLASTWTASPLCVPLPTIKRC